MPTSPNLNQDLSSGVCYKDTDDLASLGYIPCGNSALGHKSCCQAFDMCLSSNACYNAQYGVTYIAGCTDKDYEHHTCPEKPTGYTDDNWLGLAYCNGSSNAWSWCVNGPNAITIPKPCWCPKDREEQIARIAFRAGSPLMNIMLLPQATGMSVYWKDIDAYNLDHSIALSMSRAAESSSSSSSQAPVSIKTETETFTGSYAGDGDEWGLVIRTTIYTMTSSESSTTITSTMSSGAEAFNTSIPASQTAAPSAEATLASEGGLTRSAVTGAIAGAAIGWVILCITVAWLYHRYTLRRDREPDQDGPTSPSAATAGDTNGPSSFSVMRPKTDTTTQGDAEMRSPAWSGHKSELPANESIAMSPMTSYKPYRPQSSTTGSYQAYSIPPSSDGVEGERIAGSPSPTRPAQDGSLHQLGQSGRYYEMAG